MAIRFLDEEKQMPSKIRFLDEPSAPDAQASLSSRIGEDAQTRSAMAEDILSQRREGKLTMPETIFGLTGKVGAGFVGDVGGEFVKSGLDFASGLDKSLGGYGAGLFSSAANAVGSLPAGTGEGKTLAQTVPNEAQGLAEGYQKFSQENPRLALPIDSAVNLATTLVPAARSGETVVTAAKDLLRTPIKRWQISKLTSDEIRDRGSQLFKLADQQGGKVYPAFLDDFAKYTQKRIQKSPMISQLKATAGNKDAFAETYDILKNYTKKSSSFEDLKALDETLGELAYSNVDNFGKFTPSGKQYVEMQAVLRDRLESAPDYMFTGGKEAFETVKEARKYWSASLRLRDVERIVQRAEGAEQPATVIKNGFRALKNDPKRMKGYTSEERIAINKAAKDGIVGRAFKLTGSGLTPLIAGGAGYGAGGGIGAAMAAAPAFAMREGAREGSVILQKARANEVSNMMKARAIGERLPQSIPQAAVTATKEITGTVLPQSVVFNATEEQRNVGPLTQKAMDYLARKKARQLGQTQ